MKVAAPPMQPMQPMRPAVTSAEGRSDDAASGGVSFARMLESLQPTLPRSFTVATPGQVFEVETRIGDDAVSFQARPIVGPGGAIPASGEGFSPEDGSFARNAGDRALPDPDGVTDASLSMRHVSMRELGSEPGTGMSDRGVAPERAIRDVGIGGRSPSLPGPSAQQSATSSATRTMPTRLAPVAPTAPLAPTQPTARHATTAANQPVVVALLPQEVRVMVRGIDLSEDLARALSREIGRALARYGFADRAVHIVSTGKVG